MRKDHLIMCNEQKRIRISISNILYIKTEDYLVTIYAGNKTLTGLLTLGFTNKT